MTLTFSLTTTGPMPVSFAPRDAGAGDAAEYAFSATDDGLAPAAGFAARVPTDAIL